MQNITRIRRRDSNLLFVIMQITTGRRKVVSYLNGIDVTGNDDQLRLLLLDQGGDGVDSVTDDWWPLGGVGLLAVLSLGLGAGTETGSLLLLGLWAVLAQQLEQLSS